MVLTNDIDLPTEEELTVPEVNLSSAALRAGAFHLGKHCEKQNLVSLCSPSMDIVHFQIERSVVTVGNCFPYVVIPFNFRITENLLLCNF